MSHPVSSSPPVYDVLILGAGISGLSAANYLFDHGEKNFLILEASNRLGGRIYTENSSPQGNSSSSPSSSNDKEYEKIPLDFGATYFGPLQSRVKRLCKEFNISWKPIYHEGKTILTLNHHRIPYQGEIPPLNPFSLLDINYLLCETNRLCEKIPYPGASNRTKEEESLISSLDSLSVMDWLRKSSQTREGGLLYEITVKSLTCVEIHELSMYYWLLSLKSSYGPHMAMAVEDGGQECKILGGVQQIPRKLAEKINGKGKNSLSSQKIIFNSPVYKIEYQEKEKRFLVCCSPGSSSSACAALSPSSSSSFYYSRHIVFTIPPSDYSTIQFSPSLPADRFYYSKRCYMGSLYKILLRYPKAYWREKGFNGTIVDNEGPVLCSYDDCQGIEEDEKKNREKSKKINGNSGKSLSSPSKPFYGLLGLVVGDSAREFWQLSREERKLRIVEQFSRAFDCPEMLNPLEYYEYNWDSDPWCSGGFSAIQPPGLMGIPQIQQSMRNPSWNFPLSSSSSSSSSSPSSSSSSSSIQFTGSEYSTRWIGYVDGAIQSAERGAHNILQSLWNENRERIPSMENEKRLKSLGEFQEEILPENLEELSIPQRKAPSWWENHLPRPNSVKFALATALTATGVYLSSKL